MDEEFQAIAAHIDDLQELVEEFRILLADTPVNPDMRGAFDAFKTNINGFVEAIALEDSDKSIQYAKNAAVYCQVISQQSSKLNKKELQNAANLIGQRAVKLREMAENGPLSLKPLNASKSTTERSKSRDLLTANKRLLELMDEQERQDERVKKLLNENELRIASLAKRLQELEGAAQSEIDKISLAYSDGLRDIGIKKTEIDGILGHVSGRAIAGDYEKSAAEEKKMADRLRLGSLVCMVVIAGCLIYTLVGHSTDWQQSLFRISLTFLLSVPAAYLARESAKHREQQYQHLQTSLDLKALSPFVASLPDDEQHKIKIAIASKIFAGRDFSKVGADPFPINTQEIIMELLKKVDVSKTKPQKASE